MTEVIGIYNTQDWSCKFIFNVELADIAEITFVRDQSQILAWQNISGGGKIHAYRIVNGKQVVLTTELSLGERVGINKVCLSQTPLMQTLAVAPTDTNLHVFNTLSWSEQYIFDHNVDELNERNTGELLNIYRECDTKLEGIYYEALQRPFEVPKNPNK